MSVEIYEIKINTTSETDVIDITGEVEKKVGHSSIKNGIVNLFVPGSTAALTTIEYERGVINDLKEAISRMAPEDAYYEHNEKWGDGNGYSHVRAALIGPSLQVPLMGGRLLLGIWQQVVLTDFDNQPRERVVVIQIIGD